jgi:hypothetical protein
MIKQRFASGGYDFPQITLFILLGFNIDLPNIMIVLMYLPLLSIYIFGGVGGV